jgi:3'-phosphoadenosine 5'-phosphosulfate sulfotransferase (PAPS reductase)/FAD synthetase
MLMLEKTEVKYTMEDLEQLLDRFISKSFDELEEEGSYCLEICEQEDSFNMVGFWIEGTYTEAENFLMEHYKKEYFNALCDLIISRYPNSIDKLKLKMGEGRAEYRDTLAYECLATLLLKEYENSKVWYTVYGSEYEDFIDIGNKHHILNALESEAEFPVIQTSNLAAAMMGVSYSVVPSDMYDIFAYHVDNFTEKEIDLFGEERKIFTPSTFEYEAVNSRWKNYVDMAQKSKGFMMDFYELFNNAHNTAKFMEDNGLSTHELALAIQLKEIIKDDYYNRFSAPPVSLPLHKDNLTIEVAELDGNICLKANFKIRGVENKKSVWKDISVRYYDIPKSAQELMETIFKLAIDIKVGLVGMEAKKATKAMEAIPAIEGMYPRKNLATHGLRFIEDANVHYKDKHGRDCKKEAKAKFPLEWAELQSLYLLKKTLRYSKDTTISCSYGVDSIVALHLLRRVTKNDFKVIFNNSKNEYPETYEIKKKIESEWGLSNKVIETMPKMTYWELLEIQGWNFEKKGSRKEKEDGSKKSNSEVCCAKIKHVPFFELIAENSFHINITGLRADESRSRMQSGLRDGAIYYAKSFSMLRLNPIIFFTDNYVWDYISKYNVPYSKIYDMELMYEDVYENIDEEDFGKVYYAPRTGCWACMTRCNSGYLQWLKHFKPLMYWHLMKDRGLARTLFEINADKVGLAKPKTTVKAKVQKETTQISLFDTEVTNSSCTSCDTCPSAVEEISDDDIFERFSVEMMEAWITKRPCKFMNVG